MNDASAVTALPVLPAAVADVPAIHALLEIYAGEGNLLPRSEVDIRTNLADFCVVRDDCKTIACGALEVFTADLGEVRSLAVDALYTSRGVGRSIVEYLINEARARGLTRLMALTYRPEFFARLGFAVVPKSSLPEKVWGVCVTCYKFHRCDEIAVMRPL